jgi:hypothetical protein
MRNWKKLVLNGASALISEGQRTPLLCKEAAFRVIEFVASCGKSNPISFALRPIMMHRGVRVVVGINLASMVFIAAMFGPISTIASDTQIASGSAVLATEGDINLATRQAVRQPLARFVVTQGFWLLHQGIDLATSIGDPITPMMSGRVVKVEKNWFGYGNMVVVEHGRDFESLYAHMSKIFAVVGQEVTTDTIIGEVGSTGRSTGPHLHFEVHEDGKAVDPAPVLGIK